MGSEGWVSIKSKGRRVREAREGKGQKWDVMGRLVRK